MNELITVILGSMLLVALLGGRAQPPSVPQIIYVTTESHDRSQMEMGCLFVVFVPVGFWCPVDATVTHNFYATKKARV